MLSNRIYGHMYKKNSGHKHKTSMVYKYCNSDQLLNICLICIVLFALKNTEINKSGVPF